MSQKMEQQLVALSKLSKEYDDIFAGYAGRLKLPDSSFWVLYVVYTMEEPCTQYDLCKELFCTKQTVHSAVNRLIAEGYVELTGTSGTRNQKYLRLTEKGKALCDGSILPIVQAEEDAFESLGEENRLLLLSLMQQYIRSFHQRVEAMGEGKS